MTEYSRGSTEANGFILNPHFHSPDKDNNEAEYFYTFTLLDTQSRNMDNKGQFSCKKSTQSRNSHDEYQTKKQNKKLLLLQFI